MEYIIAIIVIAGFVGFAVYRISRKKKAGGTQGGGGGGSPGDDNTNTHLK